MALPTAGEKFTLQEDSSKRCLFFDQTQRDAAGDWALRAEPCDPKSATLDPKFVWEYSKLPDANLEAQGFRGVVNQGRFPDLPNSWSGNVWQWSEGQLFRGYHTQTNDPDQRIGFENASAVGDGSVRVNIGTAPIWGKPGYWAFDGADSSIKAFPWTEGLVQTFVVTVRPYIPPTTVDYSGNIATNVGLRGGSSGGVRALQVEAEGQEAAEEAGAGLRDGLFEEGGAAAELLEADADEILQAEALFSYNDSEL
eukprot:tig00020572_g11569.t1